MMQSICFYSAKKEKKNMLSFSISNKTVKETLHGSVMKRWMQMKRNGW